MMKTVSLIVSILATASLLTQAETPNSQLPSGDVKAVKQALIEAVPKTWSQIKNRNSLIFVRNDVRFLLNINPAASEDPSWEKRGYTRDYTVEVKFAAVPSEEELGQLVRAREAIRKKRTKKASESEFGMIGLDGHDIELYVDTVLPLPKFRIGDAAIWISNSSYHVNEETRPKDVLELYPALIAILKKHAISYEEFE